MKLHSISNSKYTVIVKKEPEGGFSGQCLELPGAISEGETIDELRQNITDAIQLVLQSIESRASNEEKIIIDLTV
jgi:predicted RNase H-like HicB family nuclease